MNIGIIGLWHLGEIYSICLAELGFKVIGISEDSLTVNNLNKGMTPLTEPRLSTILKRNLSKKRLSFSTDYFLIKKCEIVWLTIDTPVDQKDKANLKPIFETLTKIMPFLKNGIMIVVSSQLPVGASEKIIKFIQKQKKTLQFYYAYLPENLRLGEAVKSFFNPGRIVVGIEDKIAFKKIIGIFDKIDAKILKMNIVSAEMVKHATNSFLATSLSFIYDIADICEEVGADVTEVTNALRLDPRIGGEAYLDVSIGFSGGTLNRDLQYLLAKGKSKQIQLPVINAVFKKNRDRKKIIFKKLLKIMKNFDNKQITFFGITYKPGTSTLRRSLPLDIAKDFYNMGARVVFCDPGVEENEIKKNFRNKKYQFIKDPYKASEKSDLLICITPWQELSNINFVKLSKVMRHQKIFFDARNYFYKKEDKINSTGLKYIGIGR